MPSKTEAQVKLISNMIEGKEIQQQIISTLEKHFEDKVYLDRDEFTKHIIEILSFVSSNKTLIKGIVQSLSSPNPNGKIYKDKKGKIEADSEFNDVEIIQYKINIDEYFKEEVYPFVPNAWYEEIKEENIKIWCDINFSKIFSKEFISEPSVNILKRILEIEKKEKSFEEVISND